MSSAEIGAAVALAPLACSLGVLVWTVAWVVRDARRQLRQARRFREILKADGPGRAPWPVVDRDYRPLGRKP